MLLRKLWKLGKQHEKWKQETVEKGEEGDGIEIRKGGELIREGGKI